MGRHGSAGRLTICRDWGCLSEGLGDRRVRLGVVHGLLLWHLSLELLLLLNLGLLSGSQGHCCSICHDFGHSLNNLLASELDSNDSIASSSCCMLKHSLKRAFTSFLGHLDIRRAFTAGQRGKSTNDSFTGIRVSDSQPSDDSMGGDNLVSGIGEGGGGEAAIDGADGLRHDVE